MASRGVPWISGVARGYAASRPLRTVPQPYAGDYTDHLRRPDQVEQTGGAREHEALPEDRDQQNKEKRAQREEGVR